ncbi:DUF6930 domain-containing protein [Paenibacillus puldeungensis]|uniref:DUF6930 domain-containing protein n=1 Tax=Paenibacillus puldeungensis TaxID=696536 RepID=A0ABW3S108_9BACL
MEATTAEWSRLYEAAAQFKKMKPWEWLSNIHLFGVKDPKSHKIGYCCVMGNGGEMYGMAVYLGSAGLQTLLQMLNGDLTEVDPLFIQHCYMLSFDNRDDLYPEEYAQIKQLGLSYRGRNAWPTFRLYEPGYVPWPLTKQEDVTLLTDVIMQSMEVSLSYRKNPDALLEGEHQSFLVRIPDKSAGDNSSTWTSVWLKPEPDEPKAFHSKMMLDEIRMAKAKRAVQHIVGVWEVDSFFVPMPIHEEGRPFYPKMNLIADEASSQILHHGLTKQQEASPNLAEGLLKLIEEHKVVPSLLVSTNSKVLDELKPVIAGFGIHTQTVQETPSIEQFLQSMREHMF